MSNVKIQGNASGTGTVTIAAPNTNTDRTLTLPDGAGEILTDASNISQQAASNTPAFYVKAVNTDQSYTANAMQVVEMNNYPLDTESDWDSTNHRYVASVAGWYWFSGAVRINVSGTVEDYATAEIIKNSNNYNSGESLMAQYQYNSSIINNSTIPAPSGMLYLNGTTDYVNLVTRMTTDSTLSDNGVLFSYLSGFLVRAA